jgi:hypothetical protein
MRTETTAESRQLESNNQVGLGHQPIITCGENQFVLLPERLHQIMNHPLIVNLIVDKQTAVPGRLLQVKPQKVVVMYTRHNWSKVGANVEGKRQNETVHFLYHMNIIIQTHFNS